MHPRSQARRNVPDGTLKSLERGLFAVQYNYLSTIKMNSMQKYWEYNTPKYEFGCIFTIVFSDLVSCKAVFTLKDG